MLLLDAWGCVKGGIDNLSIDMVDRGLAAWDTLPPSVREKMSRWSPLARQLWESPFADHRTAMIRAWVWHYLVDNVLVDSEDVQDDETVPCASPVWEHVRALRRAWSGEQLPCPSIRKFHYHTNTILLPTTRTSFHQRPYET
jgi:hypothetical protein